MLCQLNSNHVFFFKSEESKEERRAARIVDLSIKVHFYPIGILCDYQ